MTKPVSTLPAPPAHDPEGFIFPHSLDVERSTLGAALLRATAADYLADHLTPDAYFRRAHQSIFESVRELRRRGVDVDVTTLREELSRRKLLEAIGGAAYLSALTDGMPRSANVEEYSNILRDLQAKRALARFGYRTVDLVAAGQHTADLLLADADRRLIELQLGHEDGRMESLHDSSVALMLNLEYRVAHAGELTGADTGFQSINELTLGWQAGDLIVLGARPSIGKTTFVVNSAVACGQTQRADGTRRRVAVFSLEMRRQQIEYRILASLSGVALSQLLAGQVMSQDWPKLSAAVGAMSEIDLHIDDRAGQSVWDIRSACRRLKAEGGLDLVVIDYVQLMPGTLDRRGATRNEEVTDISRRLKVMADEVSVPVILLSQLSRAAKDRNDPRPKLSDLRESGALEQDADIVAFLHRKNHREGGVTNFILEKQRNGPTGTVNLTLDRDTTTFTDGGEEPPAALPAEGEAPRPRRRRRQSIP